MTGILEGVDEFQSFLDEAKDFARGVLDPAMDAAAALDKINSGADRRTLAYSENGESVSFFCPSGFYPVVYDGKWLRKTACISKRRSCIPAPLSYPLL